MSPEQLEGNREIDVRTDVWALGAIAYRMLTGKLAFGTGTTAEIAARIHSAHPAAPSQLVPAIPPEVDDVIARALAKSVTDRYATALELGEALSRAAILAVPTGPGATNDGVVAVGRAPEPSRRRMAVVALLLIVCALIVVRWTRRDVAVTEPPRNATVASEPAADSAAPVLIAPALPPAVVPSSVASASVASTTSAKPVKKVIDTWHKKDEL
jgi:hypothetical protein